MKIGFYTNKEDYKKYLQNEISKQSNNFMRCTQELELAQQKNDADNLSYWEDQVRYYSRKVKKLKRELNAI